MKLWQKQTSLDERIEAYTVGNDPELDLNLIPFDCKASIAHAKMLGKIGILKSGEVDRLVDELNNIARLHEDGRFTISRSQEDGHTAIENHLTDTLGELGKKIHTARSRNDQVIAALRLYYQNELNRLTDEIDTLQTTLKQLMETQGEIEFPGYTHTRKAMVSSIRLWAEGFSAALHDDIKIIALAKDLMNQSPLGSGAGYGVPLDVDREYTARQAGFNRVQAVTYVQLSRGKLETTLVHALSQVMLDLNRMASDLILYSLPDFGFIILPDALCTGSSIMPQKKNPDVLELVRANYHVILSKEIQLKTQAANLISGYHRDLQVTKEPVLRALQITMDSVAIMRLVIDRLSVDRERCKAALTDDIRATEQVYQLVQQGMPFREAYQQIAHKYE